jgi:hypothetical protein
MEISYFDNNNNAFFFIYLFLATFVAIQRISRAVLRGTMD